MIIIKKFDAARNGKKRRVSLSCKRSGKYRSKEVKFNRKNTSEQQQSKVLVQKMWLVVSTKRQGIIKRRGWMILVVWGVHNHLASEHLEGHSFAGRLSEEEERLVVNIALFGQEIFCIH